VLDVRGWGEEGGKMKKESEIRSFRDLRVWQGAMDLVERVYELTRRFPRQEIYGLTGQLRRAAVSIPSNIAEGHSRHHGREYLHYLAVAQGSLAELETQLEISRRLQYASPAVVENILGLSTSLGKQLRALRIALAKKPAVS
jgi:four helix bundle protein